MVIRWKRRNTCPHIKWPKLPKSRISNEIVDAICIFWQIKNGIFSGNILIFSGSIFWSLMIDDIMCPKRRWCESVNATDGWLQWRQWRLKLWWYQCQLFMWNFELLICSTVDNITGQHNPLSPTAVALIIIIIIIIQKFITRTMRTVTH